MQANALVQILQPFALICLLKVTPQQLPVSNTLMWLTLVAYAVTSSLAIVALGTTPSQALLAGPLASAIIASLTAVLLYLRNFRERTIQTLTALCGSGVVLNLILLPIALMMSPGREPVAANPVATISLYVLLLWSFAVTAHVLRHALSCAFPLGLIFAIVFNLASELILDLFIDFEAIAR